MVFSDFWQKGIYFPVKEFVVIGSSSHKSMTATNKLKNQVLVISADIYHNYLSQLTKNLSSELPDISFKYKLHPNQYAQLTALKSEFSKHKNIDVIGPELDINESLQVALHVLCVQTTAAYEALQSGSFVYCYKRHNYNNHDNLAEVTGFSFIDNTCEFTALMLANNANPIFPVTEFFAPYRPECVNLFLENVEK